MSGKIDPWGVFAFILFSSVVLALFVGANIFFYIKQIYIVLYIEAAAIIGIVFYFLAYFVNGVVFEMKKKRNL